MADEVVEAVVGANVQNYRKKPLSAKSFNKKVVVSFARSPSILFDDNNVEDDDDLVEREIGSSHCSGGGDRIEIRTLICTCTAGYYNRSFFHICSVDSTHVHLAWCVPLFFCLLLWLVINEKCHQF